MIPYPLHLVRDVVQATTLNIIHTLDDHPNASIEEREQLIWQASSETEFEFVAYPQEEE